MLYEMGTGLVQHLRQRLSIFAISTCYIPIITYQTV